MGPSAGARELLVAFAHPRTVGNRPTGSSRASRLGCSSTTAQGYPHPFLAWEATSTSHEEQQQTEMRETNSESCKSEPRPSRPRLGLFCINDLIPMMRNKLGTSSIRADPHTHTHAQSRTNTQLLLHLAAMLPGLSGSKVLVEPQSPLPFARHIGLRLDTVLSDQERPTTLIDFTCSGIRTHPNTARQDRSFLILSLGNSPEPGAATHVMVGPLHGEPDI